MKYLAQEQITNYQFLSELPDVRTDKSTKLNDLTGYIPNMFNLVIGLAAVIATGWIIWGGIEYITTDSWTGKEDGKKRIKNAVIGLIIIIMSYLILYTINPRLLELDLNIQSSEVIGPTVVVAGPNNNAQNPCFNVAADSCVQENLVRSQLHDADIGLNDYSCTSSSCVTSVAGLTPATITGVIALKKDCGCTVVITGGNEGGHSATGGHPTGTSLDLRADPGLNSYFGVQNPKAGTEYNITINGKPAKALYEEIGTTSRTTGTHWHVYFPQ